MQIEQREVSHSVLVRSLDNFKSFPFVLSRVLLGLFFFVAGFNKLFHPIFQEYMLNTITKSGFAYPQFTANFTAFFEMTLGAFLLLGFLTRISSIGLITILTVALFVHDLSSIPKEIIPIDPAIGVYKMDNFTWIGYFLYLPQVLYILILLFFLVYGSGKYGLDHYIFKKK